MRIIASLVLAALTVTRAQAQDPQSRGLELVEEHCASCHAIGKTGASPFPAAPPLRAFSEHFDLDKFPGDSETFIAAGHPEMPNFRFTLEDVRAIRAYLRSLRG